MKKYKIGYVLSGGGGRGFAHVGAIKALEEFGIKPDAISGTSAGSVVGALYSSGKSPNDIMKIFSKKGIFDFLKISFPRAGIFNTSRFIKFLKKNIHFQNIEDLPIPLYVTATNFDKGETTIFSSGELAPRVMASCCVPILFKLIEIDGIHYADGGIFKNLHVSSIRDLCEIVIGINVGPVRPKYKNNLTFIGQQTYDYMIKNSMLEEKKLCDILLETKEVARHRIIGIKKSREIFNIGYKDMKETLENLSPEILEKLSTGLTPLYPPKP